MGLGMAVLPQPWQLFNIDDSNNKGGMITHYVDLQVDTSQSSRNMQFLITDIGKEDVLLGYPWLSAFEPKFSWTHGTIDKKALPVVIKSKRLEFNKDILTHLLSETDKFNIIATLEEQCVIKSMATDLAITAGPAKEVAIPKEYKEFAKVFSKEESRKFPPKRKWDHAIEFKKGTPDQINCRIYDLSQMESQQLYDFLLEQLDKGYI